MVHITSIRQLPFDIEANYTFDSNLIELANSNAKLIGNPVIPHAHWKFNESSPSSTVLDTSPSSFTGTVTGDLTFPSGKVGNAKYFDGLTFVDFTNVLTWDRTQAFTFEMWIKTIDSNGYIYQQLTTPGGQLKGFTLSIISGKLRFALYGNNLNRLIVDCDTIITDDTFKHIIITYNGNSLASGVNFYINKLVQAKTVIEDTLGVTIANNANFRIGGYAGTNYTGLMDEIVIYTRTLTQTEIDFRFNNGLGTENLINGYSVLAPTIQNITNLLFEAPIKLFEETATIPSYTGIKYQLSFDNGNTFYFWNGSAWQLITAAQTNLYYYQNQSNDATTINTNISILASSGNLIIKAFLYSETSYYTPQLDNLKIEYEKLEEIGVFDIITKFDY